MSIPIWQNNLRDAILLDPLVLIHGNVKDLFYIGREKRNGLPQRMQVRHYVPFDIWLALEFEQLGFPVVLIYDMVDGIVALRGSMIDRFSALVRVAEEKGLGNSEQQNVSRNDDEGQAAPGSLKLTTSDEASDEKPDDWMARFTEKQEPDVFFGTLYDKVFPKDDAGVAVICRFTDRYLSYTDRQDNSERKLSLLIQKAAMVIPPDTSGQPTHGRIALLFDLEGAIPQELSVQAPFAHSVRIPGPSIEERQQFFRDNYQHFASEPNDRFDPDRNVEELRDVASLSDGLKTQDLLSLVALSKREGLGLGKKQVRTLLGRFKFGTRENAWEKIPEEKLRNAKAELRESVKGQDEVIDDVVPTLILR